MSARWVETEIPRKLRLVTRHPARARRARPQARRQQQDRSAPQERFASSHRNQLALQIRDPCLHSPPCFILCTEPAPAGSTPRARQLGWRARVRHLTGQPPRGGRGRKATTQIGHVRQACDHLSHEREGGFHMQHAAHAKVRAPARSTGHGVLTLCMLLARWEPQLTGRTRKCWFEERRSSIPAG